MKLSELFEGAANLIYFKKQRACCTAITASGLSREEERQAHILFTEYFKPKRRALYQFWWISPVFSQEDQLARELALRLAAEIARDEEQKKVEMKK